MTRISFVEWSDGLLAEGAKWEEIEEHVKNSNTDILITNEMPFGAWRPVGQNFDLVQAQQWAEEHEMYLEALQNLAVNSVISSRPILVGDKLINEAFLLENNQYKVLHHKHYFPAEEGWNEASWFKKELDGFTVEQVGDIKIGVLLCTELMFNEHARDYGRSEVDLIVAPRASGRNVINWEAACSMAAVVSGSYVVSSNRVGNSKPHNPEFGGYGVAYAPGGEKLDSTNTKNPIKVIEVDAAISKEARSQYPCYLRY